MRGVGRRGNRARLLLALGVALLAHQGHAASVITTFAGGVTEGPARVVGQYATDVALHGTALYVADRAHSVIRRIDLVTGNETGVAGNGVVLGFSGDGGPATAAALYSPEAITVDAAGDLFIADLGNNRVRRVDASTGIITTVAGGGYGSDGGPAVAAGLGSPSGVAVDASGNLFISDTSEMRIRRVDHSTGIITTVAGNGTQGFGGDGGPATSAKLNVPMTIALDGHGNIFIADQLNHRVRRVDAATGLITTAAGLGTSGSTGDGGPATAAQLAEVIGVTVDPAGNLFITDVASIRRVDVMTGIITTVAGTGTTGYSGDGGTATAAAINQPFGVRVDGVGNVFIADTGNFRVRRVDASTGTITTVAGNGTGSSGDGGPASAAELLYPSGVATDPDGNVFIADSSNNRVRRVDASTGTIETVAGSDRLGFSGDGGAATAARLFNPLAVATDAAHNVFIADTYNGRVRRVDSATGIITTVAGNGTDGFAGDGGPATAAELSGPSGVAFDPAGNLFIADAGTGRVRRVDALTGIITTFAGNGGGGFSGDDGPASAAEIASPRGLATDAAGNLFIADEYNLRVRRVDATTGTITTVAGSGAVGYGGDGGPATAAAVAPIAVAVDNAGDLFIADPAAHGVRRVDGATGIITTIAGTGVFGFNGDGGPPTDAQLSNPWGIAVDALGNVFVGDGLNNRVRIITCPTCPPPTTTTTTTTSSTTTTRGCSDTDGDGVCDAVDDCPTASDGGQTDTDGDGIGDACDPCTNVGGSRTASQAKLRAARLLTPPGDDVLVLSGVIAVSTTPAIDPTRNALRILYGDAGRYGSILDEVLPTAAYDPNTGIGWLARNRSFTYLDRAGAGSVSSVKLRALRVPGHYKVRVKGKNGSYATAVGRLPVNAVVVLAASSGQCAEWRFPAMPPARPSCALSSTGSVLTCR